MGCALLWKASQRCKWWKLQTLEKKTREPLPGKTPTAYLPYFTSLPLVQCLPMHTAPPAPSTLPVILLPCYRCSLTRVEVVLTPDHSPRPPIPLLDPQSIRATSKTPEVPLSKIARGQNKPIVAIRKNSDCFVMEHNKWTTNNKWKPKDRSSYIS